MDFKDQIKVIADRVVKLKDQISTEEATKNAFIMPFLQALGYDVFNPLEVVPEFVADIGLKKGEKIDYAIFRDGVPTILIECKHWAQNLNVHDGQLLRYFHVSKARFGLLTNGIVYRFYSDLVDANKMDEKPFLEFNITDMRDNQVDELKKFHKTVFDIDSIVTTASELKFTNELKQLIQQELNSPTADFVKHFAKQVYPGMITAKILDLFTTLTKRSIQQHISDLITERLKTALTKEDEAARESSAPLEPIMPPADTNKVVTTEEELEAYMIIKAILRQTVAPSRIVFRDAQSYFAILLDDNNRKTICRLYLGAKKSVGILDLQKKEVRKELASIDDLYQYADDLKAVVQMYDGGDTVKTPTDS